MRLTRCSSRGSARSRSNGVINLRQPLSWAADSNSISWFRPPLMGCLSSLIRVRISCRDRRASWKGRVMIKKEREREEARNPPLSPILIVLRPHCCPPPPPPRLLASSFSLWNTLEKAKPSSRAFAVLSPHTQCPTERRRTSFEVESESSGREATSRFRLSFRRAASFHRLLLEVTETRKPPGLRQSGFAAPSNTPMAALQLAWPREVLPDTGRSGLGRFRGHFSCATCRRADKEPTAPSSARPDL